MDAKRRWPQFSLASMFIVIAAVALFMSQYSGDDWAVSSDKRLSLHVKAKESVVGRQSAITLLITLKNRSRDPVNVLKPAGDSYLALSTGILLYGPAGRIKYKGVTPGYTLGKVFVTLKPEETITGELALAAETYKGFEAPGKYRIRHVYKTPDTYRSDAERWGFADLWVGEIASKEVGVTRE
jgi:hypothetical protein